MVAVFNKDVLISWYLITIKLKEAVDANLQKSPPPPTQQQRGRGTSPAAAAHQRRRVAAE
jgi:hypothetical protein